MGCHDKLTTNFQWRNTKKAPAPGLGPGDTLASKTLMVPSLQVNDCDSHLIGVHACSAVSVVSDSLWLYGLQPARLLCPWNFPGKNTRAGCHFLLQGIFPTKGLNPSLLHVLYWQADSLLSEPPGKLFLTEGTAKSASHWGVGWVRLTQWKPQIGTA